MKKEKLFMIISISILVICIIGSTFALYTKTVSNDVGINTNTPGLDKYINYVKGTDITGTLNLTTTYTNGLSSNIEFWKKDNTYDIYGKIVLTINTIGTNLSNSSALKYALVNNGNVLSEGTLQGTSNNSQITLIRDLELQTTKQIYTIYVWLDSNETIGNISNEQLNISVDCTADMVKEGFAGYITDLYNRSAKTSVVNNEITYQNNENYKLMMDVGGNIRYYGSSPNNYIYFNCSDYSNQSEDTCELWRIIGVVDGKVKIMRSDSIGLLAWDQDKNIDSTLTSYDSNWSTSSLQVLLNEKYYYGDTSGTVTYYSGEDGSTETTLDMTSIGIKNNTTRNMISNEVYYLRGSQNANDEFADGMYNRERINGSVISGRPTSWNGKIALAYVSDYAYAADLKICQVQLWQYDYSTCASNNWMKPILNVSASGWLLNSHTSSSIRAYRVTNGRTHNNVIVSLAFSVVPVLYLKSTLEVASVGVGTQQNPYRLVV